METSQEEKKKISHPPFKERKAKLVSCSEETKFYIVYVKTGRKAPVFRHSTIAKATEEAIRLSKLFLTTAHVMESVGKAKYIYEGSISDNEVGIIPMEALGKLDRQRPIIKKPNKTQSTEKPI